LIGLAKLLLDTTDANIIDQMAIIGDAAKVDVMLNEAVGGEVGRLPANANAVNLGKLAYENEYSQADLAAGLVRLVAQVIAVIAINAAGAANLDHVIMAGHMMDMASFCREINLVGEFYKHSFIIPDAPGTATAIGVLNFLKVR
jgi:type II pantothenate kinase